MSSKIKLFFGPKKKPNSTEHPVYTMYSRGRRCQQRIAQSAQRVDFSGSGPLHSRPWVRCLTCVGSISCECFHCHCFLPLLTHANSRTLWSVDHVSVGNTVVRRRRPTVSDVSPCSGGNVLSVIVHCVVSLLFFSRDATHSRRHCQVRDPSLGLGT